MAAMLVTVLPRIRRRRNFILSALVILFVTYVVLLRRDDLLTRIMIDGSGIVPVKDAPTGTGAGPGAEAGNETQKPETTGSPPLPDPSQSLEPETIDNSPIIPGLEDSKKLIAQIPMSYGTAARPSFHDLPVAVADLPHKHLPRPGKPNRLVIVGDVHGQLTALKALLSEVGFDQRANGDHLILVGDMINKGEDSAGVVKLAMDLGASAVRGNHEDRILLAHREMTKNQSKSSGSWLDAIWSSDAWKADENFTPHPGTELDVATASRFSKSQLSWLESLPIILRLGPLPSGAIRPWNAGTIAVVHAGLVPGVALEKQDLRAVMNMRSLVYPAEAVRRDRVRTQLEADERKRKEKTSRGRKFEGKIEIKDEQVDAELARLQKEMSWDPSMDRVVFVPVQGREGDPWSDVWSRYQSRIKFEEDRTVVVYGHDAKAGLRVGDVEEDKGRKKDDNDGKKKSAGTESKAERYAFGLDSGCVYGRQLSALVLEAVNGGITHRIVQVDCEKKAETPDN